MRDLSRHAFIPRQVCKVTYMYVQRHHVVWDLVSKSVAYTNCCVQSSGRTIFGEH